MSFQQCKSLYEEKSDFHQLENSSYIKGVLMEYVEPVNVEIANENKIGLLLCASHIELRLRLRLRLI